MSLVQRGMTFVYIQRPKMKIGIIHLGILTKDNDN